MRFDRLCVPAYGPFTGFELELPVAGSDLHLIYGPNEAGKSSLLRAIRDLLYGIHGQTSDNFRHDYSDLRIAGTISAADGRRLSLQRRKGNRNTLLDETGSALPDETLAGFLGVVDRDFFTSIFALGSDELRQGAEALMHGEGELGQALFSASLAGTPVHRILESLNADSCLLFNGKARKNVTLRPAVTAYEEDQRHSREATVRPEAWEETLNILADTQSARDSLDEQLRTQRTRRDWLQRCLEALPTLGQLGEQERLRRELPAMPDLGAEFIESAEQALAELQRAQMELRRLDLRIEQLSTRVREDQPSNEVLARAAEIESSHQRLAVYREWRNEQVGMDVDLARVESDLRAGMRELGVAGEPEAVETLRTRAAEELALREAARNLDAVSERLQVSDDGMKRLQQALEKLTAKLIALPAEDVSALRAALAETQGAAEAAKRLPGKATELKSVERKLKRHHGLLWGAPEDYQVTFDLPVPGAATVRRFESESTQIDSRRTRLEDAASESVAKQKRLREKLQRLERHAALPTVDALHAAREHRDQGWDRVLAAWKRGAGEVEFDDRPLAEAYPLTVQAADRIADRLREDAQTVAEAEELRGQLGDAEKAGVEARAELDSTQATQEDWERRWSEAWSPCGLTPMSPAEMLEWRDEWLAFRSQFEVRERAGEELASARAAMEQATAMLVPLVSGFGERSLPALREEAERRVREADKAQGARAQLQAQETDHRADLQKLLAARPEQAEALATTQAEWQRLCRGLGLPAEASTETGLALLDQRKRLVATYDAWTSLRTSIDGKRLAIDNYEATVVELADALDLPQGSAEVQASALWSALETARAQQTRQSQAQGDLQQELAQQPQLRQALADVEQRILDCMALSESADEAALKVVLTNLKARLGIEAEIQGLRKTLHVSARGESLESFIERVRAEPNESLTAECVGLDQNILTLEAQRDQTLKDLARAEEARAKLEHSGAEAAEHLQSAHNTAVRIRHDASRYLRLRLAMHFLRRQIDEFRKQNQAPLLARAGALFSAMTEGSFDGLGTAFTADDTPLLVGLRHGKEVGIKGMSDGTRDQLYLALRLAAIERHQQHHEPLPMILDDLLLTFDDQRASAVLPILSELSAKIQIMLFTHHRHLIELARGVLAEDRYHHHELVGP